MRSNRRALSTLLRRLASVLEKLRDSDIEKIATGDFRLSFILGGNTKERTRRNRQSKLLENAEVEGVIGELQGIGNRQGGFDVLEQRCPNKACLEQLVRYLDLPLQRRDSVKRLRERIVEATIGYKLRSRAIQGEG